MLSFISSSFIISLYISFINRLKASEAAMSASPHVEPFFDAQTGTISYVVSDATTRCAAVIDPVLDFDVRSGRTSTRSADRIVGHVREHGLRVQWILETHAHADHLSGAMHVQNEVGGLIAIGERIREVQRTFGKLFNLEPAFLPDGSQFDRLFKDGERFRIGGLEAAAWLVPGHTPADIAYVIGDAVFVGDTLFMPDVGSARADFPGGDARALYRSMRRLLELPAQTRLYMCHDYPPAGREPRWQATVGEQRAGNIHVRDGIGEDEFAAMRTARDATLELPTLLFHAIQVNVRAGRLPPADDNGVSYLRIPLNALPARGR
jgi:glyoxylase-like metal-dependent hydrolase (beta-lactamase superfamily II)